jgi:hypothetical protein
MKTPSLAEEIEVARHSAHWVNLSELLARQLQGTSYRFGTVDLSEPMPPGWYPEHLQEPPDFMREGWVTHHEIDVVADGQRGVLILGEVLAAGQSSSELEGRLRAQGAMLAHLRELLAEALGALELEVEVERCLATALLVLNPEREHEWQHRGSVPIPVAFCRASRVTEVLPELFRAAFPSACATGEAERVLDAFASPNADGLHFLDHRYHLNLLHDLDQMFMGDTEERRDG